VTSIAGTITGRVPRGRSAAQQRPGDADPDRKAPVTAPAAKGAGFAVDEEDQPTAPLVRVCGVCARDDLARQRCATARRTAARLALSDCGAGRSRGLLVWCASVWATPTPAHHSQGDTACVRQLVAVRIYLRSSGVERTGGAFGVTRRDAPQAALATRRPPPSRRPLVRRAPRPSPALPSRPSTRRDRADHADPSRSR